MENRNPNARVVIPSTTRRDIIIGVVAGLVVLGLLIYGISSMSQRTTAGWLTGTIVEKKFTPQQETQITIGEKGVSSRKLAGEYTFEVKVPSDRIYTVVVNPALYDRHNIGDELRFREPPPDPEDR